MKAVVVVAVPREILSSSGIKTNFLCREKCSTSDALFFEDSPSQQRNNSCERSA